jgi:Flp pilus assembly protein TadD
VNPRDARALALQALCEVKLGLSAEAGRDIENAIKLAPTDKEVLYKKAVIRTLTGDSAGALQSLADALAHGYSATLVQSDRDLRTLRSTPEFKRLVGTSR